MIEYAAEMIQQFYSAIRYNTLHL